MNRLRPRVLVVEDNPFALRVVCWMFERWGLCTVSAGTVEHAVAMLDVPLDLIVLDLVLPDGNGASVLRAVRENKIKARVAIWTARPVTELEELRPLVPDWVIGKPALVDILEDLAATIKADFLAARSQS